MLYFKGWIEDRRWEEVVGRREAVWIEGRQDSATGVTGETGTVFTNYSQSVFNLN